MLLVHLNIVAPLKVMGGFYLETSEGPLLTWRENADWGVSIRKHVLLS